MNEYQVSDYGIFSNAVSTASTLNNNLKTDMTSLLECKAQLSDESVFMGPICDSCIQAFAKCESSVSLMSDNFSKISGYLTESATNYRLADASASSAVLNIDGGKVGTTSASAGTVNTGNASKDNVYNYLSQQGFSKAAICGILANIERESNFNPNALGDGGTSYGLCQWHNSRWTSLKNYCSQNNLNADSVDGQLSYLVYELKNKYPKVYNTLQSVPNTAQGAYDAAYAMTVGFEIPANKESAGAKRGEVASGTYWTTYGA